MAASRDKLKIMGIVMKIFGVSSYVVQWWATASEDEVLSKEELAELGLGIVEVLGLKADIELTKE